MILFTYIANAHNNFLRLIESQEGIIVPNTNTGILFHREACVWFSNYILYIHAVPKENSINFLINIWMAFSDNYKEEDVLQIEKYINDAIKIKEPNLKCYISFGRTLLENKTWSKKQSRPNLVLTFEIIDNFVRHDTIDVIKDILLKFKMQFKFSFSHISKDMFIKIFENKEHLSIQKYIEYYKNND